MITTNFLHCETHCQQHDSHLWTKTGGWWWCSPDIIIRGWDYTAQVIPMIAWQAMELSFSSNVTGTKTLKTWVLWAKHHLTSAVCNFDTYCHGISKRFFLFCVSGAEENPGNGNHWTWRPSSESSWRSNIMFWPPHHPFLIYLCTLKF